MSHPLLRSLIRLERGSSPLCRAMPFREYFPRAELSEAAAVRAASMLYFEIVRAPAPTSGRERAPFIQLARRASWRGGCGRRGGRRWGGRRGRCRHRTAPVVVDELLAGGLLAVLE